MLSIMGSARAGRQHKNISEITKTDTTHKAKGMCRGWTNAGYYRLRQGATQICLLSYILLFLPPSSFLVSKKSVLKFLSNNVSFSSFVLYKPSSVIKLIVLKSKLA